MQDRRVPNPPSCEVVTSYAFPTDDARRAPADAAVMALDALQDTSRRMEDLARALHLWDDDDPDFPRAA